MNEGPVATRLGLPGWPRQAEEVIVARDLQLAEMTGAHLHVAHASTAGTVDLLPPGPGPRGPRHRGGHPPPPDPHRRPGGRPLVVGHGLPAPYDARTKVNPPPAHRSATPALLEGLKDGTVDCVATDHAPTPRRTSSASTSSRRSASPTWRPPWGASSPRPRGQARPPPRRRRPHHPPGRRLPPPGGHPGPRRADGRDHLRSAAGVGRRPPAPLLPGQEHPPGGTPPAGPGALHRRGGGGRL